MRTRVTFLAVVMLAAAPLGAQRPSSGFLFVEPSRSLTLRGGFAMANARSDIFSFVTEQLTLGKKDFGGVSFSGEYGVRLASRLEGVFGVGVSGSNAGSEFRDFVDNQDLPIEQTTSLFRVPLTLGLKAYVTPRGRAIGQYAWIPARTALYVGVGGGAMWYRFRQKGDFVDFETSEVFDDDLESRGWAPTAHGNAGVDVSLTRRLTASLEGRYTWAKAKLSRDFVDFDPIDLSGPAVTLGLGFRF